MALIVFSTIAGAAFLYLVGGALFGGHDHDVDHDMDHDMDHDQDHDHDADHDHGFLGGFTSRLVSLKIIAIFAMVFGAVGAVTRYQGSSVLMSSVYGAASGLVIAAVMAGLFTLLYKQQANSLKKTSLLKNKVGIVEVSIPAAGYGEVIVDNQQLLAKSSDNTPIERGMRVKVVDTEGSTLLVKKEG